MLTYITRAGDTVDWIAWRQYGSTATDLIVAIYNANYNLSKNAPVLPAGLVITLPDIQQPETVSKEIVLWD